MPPQSSEMSGQANSGGSDDGRSDDEFKFNTTFGHNLRHRPHCLGAPLRFKSCSSAIRTMATKALLVVRRFRRLPIPSPMLGRFSSPISPIPSMTPFKPLHPIAPPIPVLFCWFSAEPPKNGDASRSGNLSTSLLFI
ncbi:uncharacterized protein LOC132303042 isoform X3 [Cornus florida]|uniref:uncharacterized protein LOC132303042 isoform X3 n=1 Tax=Cornus florida TaxID=4283 RepID=UPI00289DFF56|nr:uncharacterized protein LOC132303042 isoform X3 [Cornus florida]XP_059656073.1 uncharacterized protein LOC132303042 isoform X3 [Cornus florida]